MRNISTLFLAGIFYLSACHQETGHHEMHNAADLSAESYIQKLNSGEIAEDTLKGSPSRVAMATIAGNHIHISYHAPGVKKRVIWGGLVPYDAVWVSGAHNATSIRFMKTVIIENQEIPAGTYAIFTIPGKENWTFILNKNYEQHLTDAYKQEEDVLRIPVKPSENDFTQRLTYEVKVTGENEGVIQMRWENIGIGIPFSMKAD